MKKGQQGAKRYFPVEERKNFKKLISKKGEYEGTTLTFEHHDGSKKVTETNDSFFKDVNGEMLPPNKVMENVNALKHDYNANNVIIN
jgi:hypothetical protein